MKNSDIIYSPSCRSKTVYDSVSFVNNALAAFFSDTFKLKIEHKNMIKVSQT